MIDDVLKEKQRPIEPGQVRRPEEGGEQRHVSADQDPFGGAGDERLDRGTARRVGQRAERGGARDRPQEVGQVVSVGLGHGVGHRPVKRHDPRAVVKGQVERRDVAVADEHLGVAADEIVVQRGQHPHRPVPPADAHHGVHVGVREHRPEVGRPPGVRPREITSGLQGVRGDDGPEPFLRKPRARLLESLRGGGGARGGGPGRRNQADGLPPCEPGWLDGGARHRGRGSSAGPRPPSGGRVDLHGPPEYTEDANFRWR